MEDEESVKKMLSVLMKGQADRITVLEKQNEQLREDITELKKNPLGLEVRSLGDVLKLS